MFFLAFEAIVMIKAVLFDLDGTLVDSLADLAEAGNRAIAKFGCPPHLVGRYKYFVGDGIPKLIERILPESMRNETQMRKCLKAFFEYYSVHFADKTYAYEGMPQMVSLLHDNGVKVAVVSNKAQEMAELVVGKLYGDVFDLVLGKREGVAAKPDPSMLLLALEQLGTEPQDCAFVGDSGMDMAAAVNAGAVPVGVLWGFRTADELKANGARFLASNPSELADIIRGIK